jgi:hypothetical protein
MLRKAETLEDFDRDLRAFNCMDRIPEIKVGKYFYSDIMFNTIGSDVVAFYSKALNKKVEKLEAQFIEAKDLIRNLLRVTYGEGWNYSLDWKVKAEQFLKE